jgi:hypothetical protein
MALDDIEVTGRIEQPQEPPPASSKAGATISRRIDFRSAGLGSRRTAGHPIVQTRSWS